MTRPYILFLYLLAGVAKAQDISGLWHATVLNRLDQEVAFQSELARSGPGWKGFLRNGGERIESTAGSFRDGRLRLEFNYWDGVLEAELRNGEWSGAFTRQYRKEVLVRKFRAQRGPVWKPRGAPQGNFSGEWLLEVDNEGKLQVYRGFIQQKGNLVEATLIELSGDSGLLTGLVENRRLLVSRFDGIRATRFEITMAEDGTVRGLLDSKMKVQGARVGQTQLEAPEASSYTRMKAGETRLRWAYPDLEGRMVASTDARFAGKVILVTITGSWCPNCHDEAPLLRELYERYHAQGLEIVGIAFEYTGEADRDLRQLRLFRDKYKLPFPLLLAGSTDEAQEKLAQLENFAGYPTAIYIGRDGTVRGIHSGFTGPATGARHGALKDEMESTVRKLLAEK